MMVKTILVFGAKVNCLNNDLKTPLDIAMAKTNHKILAILVSAGGELGENVLKKDNDNQYKLKPFEKVCRYYYKRPTVGFHCT